MDFTVEQFLDMFHRYNEAIWPMQIVGYAIGLFIVAVLVARHRGSRSFLASPTVLDRLVPALLASYWAWLGVVFMWGYQADLSASGRPFGVLLLVGAAAFGVAALVGADLGLGRAPSWRLAVGAGMVVYGMVDLPAAWGARRPCLSVGPGLRRGAVPDHDLHARCAPLLRAASLVPPGLPLHLGLHRDDGSRQASASPKTSASSSQLVLTVVVVFWLGSPRRVSDHGALVSPSRQ